MNGSRYQSDEARRMRERHSVQPGCVNVHCVIHDIDEYERPGDYRTCGECWHVYRTEKQLIDAYRATTPYRVPVDITGNHITFCPLCAHDF